MTKQRLSRKPEAKKVILKLTGNSMTCTIRYYCPWCEKESGMGKTKCHNCGKLIRLETEKEVQKLCDEFFKKNAGEE